MEQDVYRPWSGILSSDKTMTGCVFIHRTYSDRKSTLLITGENVRVTTQPGLKNSQERGILPHKAATQDTRQVVYVSPVPEM